MAIGGRSGAGRGRADRGSRIAHGREHDRVARRCGAGRLAAADQRRAAVLRAARRGGGTGAGRPAGWAYARGCARPRPGQRRAAGGARGPARGGRALQRGAARLCAGAAGGPGARRGADGSGRAASRRGLWTDALPPLRRATEVDPGRAAAWYYLGEALNHVDDLPAAQAAYERAVELEPRNARALHRLGIVLDRLNRPAEATRMYRRSREAAAR